MKARSARKPAPAPGDIADSARLLSTIDRLQALIPTIAEADRERARLNDMILRLVGRARLLVGKLTDQAMRSNGRVNWGYQQTLNRHISKLQTFRALVPRAVKGLQFEHVAPRAGKQSRLYEAALKLPGRLSTSQVIDQLHPGTIRRVDGVKRELTWVDHHGRERKIGIRSFQVRLSKLRKERSQAKRPTKGKK